MRSIFAASTKSLILKRKAYKLGGVAVACAMALGIKAIAMLVRTIAKAAALTLLASGFGGTTAAVAAPFASAQIAPALALCISPGVLFGVAFTAPMALLAVGFAAMLATDRMG